MEKEAECFCRRYIFRQLRCQLSLRRTPLVSAPEQKSAFVVNRNQAKRLSAMDNKTDYDSILTK